MTDNKSLDAFWNFIEGEKPNFGYMERCLEKVDKLTRHAIENALHGVQAHTNDTYENVYSQHLGTVKRLSKKLLAYSTVWRDAHTEMEQEIENGESHLP